MVDFAVFDTLIDGTSVGSVPVGHDAHVIVMDIAVADSDMVGLVDAHSGAVIVCVGCPGEFEALEQTVVRTGIELKDRPGRAPPPTVVEPLARELNALTGIDAGGTDNQVRLVHGHCNALVSLSARTRIDPNFVTGHRHRHRLLDAAEPLAWSNFQRDGQGSLPDTHQ